MKEDEDGDSSDGGYLDVFFLVLVQSPIQMWESMPTMIPISTECLQRAQPSTLIHMPVMSSSSDGTSAYAGI
jgi:hypothetical protein